MLLRSDLDWLPGFPDRGTDGAQEQDRVDGDGLPWYAASCYDENGLIRHQVTRENIHRAVFARKKLQGQYDVVLPKLFSDPQWWLSGTERLLDLVKQSIHDGVPAPAHLLDIPNGYSATAIRKARETTRLQPELKPLLDALSWTYYLDPKSFGLAVNWVARSSDALVRLVHIDRERPIVALMQSLCILELRAKGMVQPYLECLINRPAANRPTGVANFRMQTRQLIKRQQRRGRPAVALAKAKNLLKTYDSSRIRYIDPGTGKGFDDPLVTPWWQVVNWLLHQNATTTKKALSLFDFLVPADVVRGWRIWWEELEALKTRLDREPADHPKIKKEDLLHSLRNLLENEPPTLHVEAMLRGIAQAAQPSFKKMGDQLVKCIGRLPETIRGRLVRPAMFMHFMALHENREESLGVFIESFLRYQAKGTLRPAVRYSAWLSVIDYWHRGFCEQMAFTGPTRHMMRLYRERREMNRAFAAMLSCKEARNRPFREEHTRWALTLAGASDTPETAATRFVTMMRQEGEPRYPFRRYLAIADRIADDAEDFCKLYQTLRETQNMMPQYGAILLSMHEQLKSAGWSSLVRDVIHDGQMAELITLVPLVRMADTLSLRVTLPSDPEPATVPTWARHYPTELHKALGRLDSLSDTAEASCKRLLKSVFFEPHRIAQEVEAILRLMRVRRDDPKLRTRLENLRKRKHADTRPDKALVRKALQRINRQIRHVVLHQWNVRIRETLSDSLAAFLGTDGDVDLLLADPHLSVLTHVWELEEHAVRKMAFKIYRRRTGSSSWNMNDAPPNRRFVDAMIKQGVHMLPWLEESPPSAWDAPNGQTYHVGFEADPLEVFQMGAPFGTCLSPGDFNFFSAITNAADVNKKVLYARDHRQQIVARCLFALSDAGGILTFHPYSHDTAMGFSSYVAETARNLANRMGTVAMDRGSVSALMVSDWYDDGPVDLCGRFPFLEGGSTFRKELLARPQIELRPLIRETFAPLPLNTLTLSLLLELSECEERPGIVCAVMPELEDVDDLTMRQWKTAIDCLEKAGERGSAINLIQRRIIPKFRRQRGDSTWATTILESIADIDPSSALRAIRATRDSNIRDDSEESVPRQEILIKAYRNLGRRKKAELLHKKNESRNRTR
ncbi:MAG: hypothetical protein ACPGXK_14630 [Phycisphaerae bacterium]